MEGLEKFGLLCRQTGAGTNRVMTTVRHNGSYVGAVCCCVQKNRYGAAKKWVWTHLIKRPELTPVQIAAIKTYLASMKATYDAKTFGDQQ